MESVELDQTGSQMFLDLGFPVTQNAQWADCNQREKPSAESLYAASP